MSLGPAVLCGQMRGHGIWTQDLGRRGSAQAEIQHDGRPSQDQQPEEPESDADGQEQSGVHPNADVDGNAARSRGVHDNH